MYSEFENLPDSMLGKFIVCSEYGTHGAVDVWEENYGVFNTEEEAEKLIKENGRKYLRVSEVTKHKDKRGNLYTWPLKLVLKEGDRPLRSCSINRKSRNQKS
jgi:hypothetical protein